MVDTSTSERMSWRGCVIVIHVPLRPPQYSMKTTAGLPASYPPLPHRYALVALVAPGASVSHTE